MSDYILKLIEDARNDGLQRGKADGDAIIVGDGYDSRQAVIVLRSEFLMGIRHEIRGRRWRRSGDNPGAAYLGTCEPLKILRNDAGWQCICLVAVHYDV